METPVNSDKARVEAGQGAKQGVHANSSAAQRQRLLAALRQGPVTTFDARGRYDVMHPGGRVMELRRIGHSIATIWTVETSDLGRPHRVGKYVLMQEALL